MRRRTRILLAVALPACGLVVLGGAWFLLASPPAQPGQLTQELFRGVTYFREVRQHPRPIVCHVCTVDMDTPGISFLVTPPAREATGHDMPLIPRKTSTFLSEFGVQVAVNGDFFVPCPSGEPPRDGPGSGGMVRPYFFAASRGRVYSHSEDTKATLFFSKSGQAGIGKPTGDIWHAISGNAVLVTKGEIQPVDSDALHPRTAVGLDREGRKLILVVVDGRQRGYSEGTTLLELAELLFRHGAYDAVNLDGGGSSTLVAEGQDGSPLILNSPINDGIPGRERAVGNHLGICADPLEKKGVQPRGK